jgi:hypothetical protein
MAGAAAENRQYAFHSGSVVKASYDRGDPAVSCSVAPPLVALWNRVAKKRVACTLTALLFASMAGGLEVAALTVALQQATAWFLNAVRIEINPDCVGFGFLAVEFT